MNSMLPLVAGFPWASNVSCRLELPGPPGRMISPSQFTVSTNWVPGGTGPTTTLRIVRIGWLPPSTPAPAGPAATTTNAPAAAITAINFRRGPTRSGRTLAAPQGLERRRGVDEGLCSTNVLDDDRIPRQERVVQTPDRGDIVVGHLPR